MSAARYFTGKPCKRGHIAERFVRRGICVECNRLKAAARRQSHPAETRAAVAAAYAKYDYSKTHNESNRKWRAAHPEAAAAIRRRAFEKLGSVYFRAARAKRRATEAQQMPPWADPKSIARIYAGCPAGHHVDHEIPLRGQFVSGLHVEANLQYLSAEANHRKHNKFEVV